jgi:hypothetical protein
MDTNDIKLDHVFEEAKHAVEEARGKRAARRKELEDKDVSADIRVVAWIDILGFSRLLQAAKQDRAEMQRLYRTVLAVQEIFGAPHASDEPNEMEETNRFYGRDVVALSDGLVVSARVKSPAQTGMTYYDLLMSFIGDLITAQTDCAVRGIFIRGAVAIGPYYYENNILLSPALVEAYKMETEKASYPIIIIKQEDVAELRALPGINHYAKEAEPSLDYFQPFKSPTAEKGDRFYFLDYLRYLANPANHAWHTEADRWACHAAPENLRQAIFDKSHRNAAAHFMRVHKQRVREAFSKAGKAVRPKYRWLAEYQNRTLVGFPSRFSTARFVLNREVPATSPVRAPEPPKRKRKPAGRKKTSPSQARSKAKKRSIGRHVR